MNVWGQKRPGVADPKEGGNGVLTLLDGVASKFSKMEAEARLQDETDQKKRLQKRLIFFSNIIVFGKGYTRQRFPMESMALVPWSPTSQKVPAPKSPRHGH